MSEIGDDEVAQFLTNQEQQRLKKQYRGVMICNQPQRWQYSIEQVGEVKEYPFVSNPKEKKENPLLIKQEKKLRKEFKKVHEKNKEYFDSLSTLHDERSMLNGGGAERCISMISNRTEDINKNSITYLRSASLRRGNSQMTSSDEQNIHTKRSISTNSKRLEFADQKTNLKVRFDDYNKAVSEMNKQQGEKKFNLPKIFDEQKSIQIEHLRSDSANRRKQASNKYYPHEIFQNKDKKITKVMNEQQQMMRRIISSKLDPVEQEELYDQQGLIDMEMIDPVQISDFHIKNTSPTRKRKLKVKRIKSAKLKSPSRESSPQQSIVKDVKKILKFKSELNNLYFNFMSSMKVIK